MESRFKLKISRMFRSSFASCKPNKNLTDVIENPSLLSAENNKIHQDGKKYHHNHHHHHFIELFCPMCKPRWPESVLQAQQDCIVTKNLLPRKKITESRRSLLLAADFMDGRKCPPASPAVSPFNFQDSKSKPKVKINKRVQAISYNGLFSSDDEEEDDKTTLFSSRSLSSDSSESFRQTRGGSKKKKKKKKNSQRRNYKQLEEKCTIMPLEEKKRKVKDSFAVVVKKSSDPYSDFRKSMVEMIIEKQIFNGNDLENLLECFLSLNSYHHHNVIIQVFTDVWEALFSI